MTTETAALPRSSRFGGFFRRLWARRGVKWFLALTALLLIAGVAAYTTMLRTLPSAESLLTYEPPLPTNIRGINGEPVQSFARERRVQLSYDEYPRQLIQAYLAAEDRTFFTHGGIDYPGILSAVVTNLKSGGRPVGASTITQQVAKNLLLTNELSYTRKIKEAFLAKRMEAVLTKQQILELYLNQIFLGRNAYGVQAAARAYFDKDVDGLALHEMAFLSILPKAPSNYSPERFPDRALGRRNWVLGEMERNGFITPQQRAAAQNQPLDVVRGPRNSVRNVGGYFMEDVRRLLVERYGEKAEQGPHSVYAGGLWVRTSYDHARQQAAEAAFRDGLMRYDGGRQWRDSKLSIDVSGDWRTQLAIADYGTGYPEWRPAVVLAKEGGEASLGFTDGSKGVLPSAAAQMPKRGGGGSAWSNLRPGMIIAVKSDGDDRYALRSVPEISGGMFVQEVATGRVLAMQGGWDVRGSSFNRATQALRQPGSTFKPIVFSAALDNGMTPASIIVDGPFCVFQSASLGSKCFRNFAGGSAGPQTMRWGLEQSRNLMTVRAANQIGIDKVTRLARRLDVGDYENYLSISLGAGDTTVAKMTNAFAIMANQGRQIKPSLIDYIQDRNGKVIFRNDTRCGAMGNCNARDWDGKPMPRPPLRTKQIMDAMTAYQMVHILEGVITRGTAQRLKDLNRPLFGKTGTTSGPNDVWFIGGTPEIVAGVYLGFDQPRSLGGAAQGGRLAAPIFKEFAQKAFKDMPVVPFRAPPGVRLVRIDRRSGHKVFGDWPSDKDAKAAVIWEAFKPESEPRRTRQAYATNRAEALLEALRAQGTIARPRPRPAVGGPREDSDFLQREGGIY